MTIRTLFVTIAFVLSGTGSLFAQGVSPAVADYEKAAEQEKKLELELSAVEQIDSDVSNVTYYADNVTASLKSAEDTGKKRAEALALLPAKANAALAGRKAALAAVDAYRAAAEEALKAIAVYACADRETAETKAGPADVALDKKAALKRKAEDAVAAAGNAGEDFDTALAAIQKLDADVKRYLSEARSLGEEVISLCGALADRVKGQKPDLAATVTASLAQVRGRVDSLISHAAQTGSADSDAFRSLLGDLGETRSSEKTDLAAVEGYFEASVYTVIKGESYSFVAAMHGGRNAGTSSIDELDAAALSMQKALAEADDGRQRVMENNRAAGESFAALGKMIERLPGGVAGIAGLINESSTLVFGFDGAEQSVQAAVEAKRKEHRAARRDADKAYFVAFGRERHHEVLAKAAAPEQPLQTKMGQPMQVLEHVYAQVYALSGEPKDYGAYTYVLFRQNYNDAQSHIKKRYEALLKAIYRSTSPAQNFSAPIPKGRLNLFCIPFKKNPGLPDEYDSDLARSYLATAGSGTILRENILSQIRNSPGPFLLTTRTRLSDGSSKTQLLFVDLSGYDAETFDALLAAYKNTIVQQPPQGQVLWRPPAADRVLYAAVSASNAVPGLLAKIRKIVDFFIPSAQASPGG